MTTIHDVQTVRRPVILDPGVPPTAATVKADAATVAKALGLIALAVVAIGAAAVALTLFLVLPPIP